LAVSICPGPQLSSSLPIALTGILVADTVLWLMATGLLHSQIRRARAAAENRLAARMPEIVSSLRAEVSRPQNAETSDTVRELAGEAAGLAAAVGKRDAALPLVYLADDVARGVSPRKALPRYLDVFGTLLDPQASPRLLEDARREVECMRDRINVFA
jgi:hypothetical protein